MSSVRSAIGDLLARLRVGGGEGGQPASGPAEDVGRRASPRAASPRRPHSPAASTARRLHRAERLGREPLHGRQALRVGAAGRGERIGHGENSRGDGAGSICVIASAATLPIAPAANAVGAR